MMRALVNAGFNGDFVAGYIAAQRCDGILSAYAPRWGLEAAIISWGRAQNLPSLVQAMIDDVRAAQMPSPSAGDPKSAPQGNA